MKKVFKACCNDHSNSWSQSSTTCFCGIE